MPRVKDFVKTFEIQCSATGSNQAQAEYFHSLDIDYKKRWIKGELSEETEKKVFNHCDGNVTITNTLKFKSNYFKDPNNE